MSLHKEQNTENDPQQTREEDEKLFSRIKFWGKDAIFKKVVSNSAIYLPTRHQRCAQRPGCQSSGCGELW